MMNVTKLCLSAVAVAGLLTVSSVAAEAKGFSAGHYRFTAENGANQTVCVRNDGSWFGTSFPNWSGRWANRNLNGTLTGFLWGNFFSGNGNNSIIALGVANSKWTEWADNNSFSPTALNQVRITKISGFCPALSPRASSSEETPAANR